MFIYERDYAKKESSSGEEVKFEALNVVFEKGNQIPVGFDSEGHSLAADVVMYKEFLKDSEGKRTIPGPIHVLVGGKEVVVS